MMQEFLIQLKIDDSRESELHAILETMKSLIPEKLVVLREYQGTWKTIVEFKDLNAYWKNKGSE